MDNLIFDLRQMQSNGRTTSLRCLGMEAADKIEELTTANADLQQRMDAAEEALRVAQGEVVKYRQRADKCQALTEQARQKCKGLVQALTTANSRVERLREALEIYRELLEECKSFCCRTDGDGDALHIGLARRIHATLEAQKALADDAKEGM